MKLEDALNTQLSRFSEDETVEDTDDFEARNLLQAFYYFIKAYLRRFGSFKDSFPKSSDTFGSTV